MFAFKFLRRHWGKLLLLFLFLYIFGYVDELEESLGFNTGRMVMLQEGGGLAPFPKERSNLKVRHSIGLFHDVYYIYFRAKPETVLQWMHNSPGIMGAKPHVTSNGSTCFWLGSGRGYVYVSADRTEVGMVRGNCIDGPASDSPIPYRHETYKHE
jgi:hypothetical protein